MSLTSRQAAILAAIIQQYSQDAKPVSSKHLVQKKLFDYSSATLRAEMAELERKKFLYKPHTSAGRVPTDEGYRFYIRELMDKTQLPPEEKSRLKTKISKMQKDKSFPKELAEILADFSNVLALVGLSTENHLYFAGLTSLGQRTEPEIFCDIAHFLEETEKDFEQFFSLSYDYEVPSIFIGKEHPFLRGTRCGLIVSRYPSRFNEGFIGLLGPNRMDYGRNLSLLEYVNQLFESL